MSFDFHLEIPEDGERGQVIQTIAAQLHITPEQAAEKVFDDGLKIQMAPHAPGNIWGIGAEDADVLDQIVTDAMSERRKRFAQRLNA